MSLIYIVRHANTFDKGEVIRRVGGATDLPLSRSGRDQAQALGEHFSHIEFGRVFCSALKRQRETAQAILDAQMVLPENVVSIGTKANHIETADFLREIDYGVDENKPEADVIARIGALAMSGWDMQARVPSGWNVDPEAIRREWRNVFMAHKADKQPVLIVTSNGIARFILDVASHKPSLPRKLRTGAYGIVDTISAVPKVLSWDIRPNEI